MVIVRLFIVLIVGVGLVACGDDVSEQSQPSVETAKPEPRQSEVISQDTTVNQSVGGVSVSLLPENPTSSDCLRVVVKGVPGRNAVIWSVNGSVVATGSDTQICPEHFQRDDLVDVQVGTIDQGATASVTIANSRPRIVDISSSPAEIFAGMDVSVEPVAEDVDGDDVSFRYQWLINGEENPVLTEAVLPGNAFTKGDSLQVLITPNDFYVDGPVYESYSTPVPNAPPSITSEPPEGITSLDYRYQVEVSDPDDSQFTYRLVEAPEGMQIDPASGLIKWSLGGVEPGEYTILIIVTDPEGAEGAQEYKLTLGAPE